MPFRPVSAGFGPVPGGFGGDFDVFCATGVSDRLAAGADHSGNLPGGLPGSFCMIFWGADLIIRDGQGRLDRKEFCVSGW